MRRRSGGRCSTTAAIPSRTRSTCPAPAPTAVATGSEGGFLVAWQDQPPRALNLGIYGQLLSNQVHVFLPLTVRSR